MKRAIRILVLMLCASSLAHGQALDSSSDAQTGREPFGAYFSADLDSINLYSGNLLLDIKLFNRTGRELSTGLRPIYNSQKWQQFSCTFLGCGIYTGGWKNNDLIGELPGFGNQVIGECPNGDRQYLLYATWVDGLGTKHLYSYSYQSCTDVQHSPDPIFENRTFLSVDGNNSRIEVGSTIADIRMTFKDGHVLDFGHTQGDPIGGKPSIITPNGNFLSRDGNGVISPDTVKRSIVFSTDFDSSNQNQNYDYHKSYTVTDANGIPRTYTLNYRGNVLALNPWESQQQGHSVFSPITILRSIDLPNNTAYIFAYDHPQGFLTQVTLPTGGYLKYTYPAANTLPANDYVVERRVSDDGVTEQVWTYTRGANSVCPGSSREVTVMSPITTERVVHCFDSSGLETTTLWQEYVNPVWLTSKTVATQWTNDGQTMAQPTNPRPQVITTTMGGVSRKTALHYDGNLNVDCVREGDWSISAYNLPNNDCNPVAATSLLAQRNYAYTQTGSLSPWQTIGAENLFGINPETGTFDLQGATEYSYNQSTLTPRSGVPNNDQSLSVAASACAVPQPCFPRSLTTIRRHTASTVYDETFTYDQLGNILTDTDPLNHVTTIGYVDNFEGSDAVSSFAYPTQLTDSVSHIAATKYDYNTGLPVQSTDARGLKTTFTYEGLNRPDTILEANGHTIKYAYDDATPKVVQEEKVALTGETRHTETTFDKLYRVRHVLQSDPIAGDVYADRQYDVKGRITRVSEPYRTGTPVWAINEYDVQDRVKKVTHSDSFGSFITYSYTGNTATITDEAGNQRGVTTNGLGQLTRVVEYPTPSTPLTTDYTYYVFGSLRQVNQSGLMRTFSYDWLGHLTSESHPESGPTSYTLDGDGRVHQRTDARLKVTTYNYDDIDRPTSITYSDETPPVSYTYDQGGYVGLLTTAAVTGVTTTNYTYTTSGQIASESSTLNGVPGTFTNSYTYDLAGRLKTIGYPSGRVVQRTYQASGVTAVDRLSTLTDQTTLTTLVGTVQDNAAGLMTSQVLGSGLTEGRGYNSRNQLTSITVTRSGTNVLGFTYDYGTTNNTGRIRSRTDTIQADQSANYTYDGVNRLTDVTNATWSLHWELDAYGNRTVQSPAGVAVGKVNSQTFGYLFNKHASSFQYDGAGNIIGDGSHNYTYDAEGRVKLIDGGTVQFDYDSEGRRIKKTASGTTTFYFYGLVGLMSEFTLTNTGAIQAASTNILQYRVGEQTETAVPLTDAAGGSTSYNRVLPFGEPWDSSSPSSLDQKFTTYDRERVSGLDYAMDRFYDSQTGRFMSPDRTGLNIDLANPQSWNAYSYVNGDPINFTDPSGDGLFSILFRLAVAVVSIFNPGIGAALAGPAFGIGHLNIGGANSGLWNEQLPTSTGTAVNTGSVFGSGNTDGLVYSYSSAEHIRMTRDAGGSLTFALAVAGVDLWSHSQSPFNSHWHAMGELVTDKTLKSWRKPRTHPESPCEAYKGTIAELGAATNRALGSDSSEAELAVHMIQDSYAGGHQYQYWPGSLPSFAHVKADSTFSSEPVDATRRYLQALAGSTPMQSPGAYLAPGPAGCR
jgi:RHS repeat-associated protein